MMVFKHLTVKGWRYKTCRHCRTHHGFDYLLKSDRKRCRERMESITRWQIRRMKEGAL